MIPDTIKLIVAKGTWRKWVNKVTERVEEFASFEEFVREPLPDGLGSEIRTLKHLCQDTPEALDAIDRATVGEWGGDRKSEDIKGVNHSLDPSTEAKKRDRSGQLLRRLREQRPDLHARVLNKEKSVAAAATEAGFYPKRVSVNLRSPESAASSIRRSASPEFIEALAELLQRG
jgi:hypothetical protein